MIHNMDLVADLTEDPSAVPVYGLRAVVSLTAEGIPAVTWCWHGEPEPLQMVALLEQMKFLIQTEVLVGSHTTETEIIEGQLDDD